LTNSWPLHSKSNNTNRLLMGSPSSTRGSKPRSLNEIIFIQFNQTEYKETQVCRKTTIFFFWASKKKPNEEEMQRRTLLAWSPNKNPIFLPPITIMIIRLWLLVRCRSKNAKKSYCKTNNTLFTFWVHFDVFNFFLVLVDYRLITFANLFKHMPFSLISGNIRLPCCLLFLF
jgi:hypothetical protein